MYKHYADQIIRMCVLKEEMVSILHHCHFNEHGGHFGSTKNGRKGTVITVFRSTWKIKKTINEVAIDLFCTGVIGHSGHMFLN